MKFNFKRSFCLSLFVLFLCCYGQSNASCQANTSYKTEQSDSVAFAVNMARIDDLKSSMTDYMKAVAPLYNGKDIDECVRILTEYLKELKKTSSGKEGLLIVKSTVLALNRLNEKCDFRLIETGEREQIAQIINTAAQEKGYNKTGEDITEEWREW